MTFGLSMRIPAAWIMRLCMASAMCAGGHVQAAPSELSQDERAAYEKALSIPPFGNLHDAPRFFDGVKGRVISGGSDRRNVPVYPAGMTRADDFRYWETVCRSSLVAIATHLDSTTFLTSHQDGIVTRNRFRVDEVIKARNGIVANSIVMTARQGGEVVDAGERLRAAGEFGPYIPGQRYFLIAYQDEGADPDKFVEVYPPVILDGAIAYVQGGFDVSRSPLSSYFEVQRFVAKFNSIAEKFPCPAR